MRKMNIARRRGTSIAAAALSLALVAPTVQPVAFAQQDADSPAVAAPAGDNSLEDAIHAERQVIDADPIASGRITQPSHLTNVFGQGYGLLSGHITEATPGDSLTANPFTSGGTGGVPAPEGTYVYAQFRDVDGSVSPIFRTQVHNLEGTVVGLNGGQGTFAFGLPQVDTPEGVPEITAEPGTPEYEEQVKAAEEAAKTIENSTDGVKSVSGSKRRGGMEWTDANGKVHRFHGRGSQQYRLWVDPYENDRGQLVEPFRQVNGIVPGSFVDVSTAQNNGAWPSVGAAMNLTGMIMKERPAEWMVGKDSPVMQKAVEDTEGARRDAETLTDLDRYIAGEVWLEAGNGTSITNAPNRDRRDRPAAGYRVYASTLTREGAIANQQQVKDLTTPAEKTAATKKLLEDHPEYILKTVWGYTDEEGNYTLRFDDAENPSNEDTDYVDFDNLFMWVTDPTGEKTMDTYSPYITNSFFNFNDNTAWSSGTPYKRPVRKAIANQHFAVMVNEQQSLNITNFDAFQNPAKPGETAEIEVTGTFPPFDGDSNWVNVVWRDQKGKELKRWKNIGSATEASKCSFDIPEDYPSGEIINAELVVGDRVVSADSLMVIDRERDNGKYTPEYEETTAPQGEDTTIPAPKNTQEDEEGNVPELPEGTKFTPGNQVVGPDGPLADDEGNPEWPDWIKVNPDGSITVTPDENTPVGEYNIPVVTTYPDGSKETIYAPVEVTEGFEKPTDNGQSGQADEITPSWENSKTPAGEPVKVPNTGEAIPDGSKVDAVSDKGWTVTSTPEGEISVTPPADAKTGDKSTIWVTVTYPDGSQDVEKFTVTVQNDDDGDGDPTNDGDDAAKTTPDWENSETKPNEPVDIPNTGDKLPKDSEVKVPDTVKDQSGNDWTVEVVGDNGDIKVTPPEGAKPGDKVEVEIEVTYPDGSTDKETVTVTVTSDYDVEYEAGKGKVDTDIEAKPVPAEGTTEIPAGTKYATAKDDNGQPNQKTHDGLWTIEDPDENGVVVAKVDSKQLKERYTSEHSKVIGDKCKNGEEITEQEAKDLIEKLKPLFAANSVIDVTFPNGDEDEATANFALLDAKGNPMAESDDWDGDGVSNIEEIQKCSDPFDPDSKPEAPVEKPDWDDTTGTPGNEIKIPKKDGSGDVPEGTTLEVEGPGKAELDDDDNIVVTPNEDAKPGDKIVVKVKDKDGNVIDEVTVTVVDPWGDAETYPGKPVEVEKDKSFEVPEGATVEVTEGNDKGTAELLPNGNIKVTPNDNAKPGDKIVVEVKDKDGNKVDDFTVKIVEKPISSSDRKGCTESLIGFGLPLLALIPLGIASQTAIPGLQNIQAQVGRQIQDANTALQNQLGVMDPRLAKAAADFQAQLRGAGANLSQVLGGIAVLAYGIAAITTIAVKCGPGNTEIRDTNVDIDSIFGGSSTRGEKEGDNASSLEKQESSSSSSKRQENEDAPANPEAEAEANDAEAPAADENTEE